jgi:hypothetical protein
MGRDSRNPDPDMGKDQNANGGLVCAHAAEGGSSLFSLGGAGFEKSRPWLSLSF